MATQMQIDFIKNYMTTNGITPEDLGVKMNTDLHKNYLLLVDDNTKLKQHYQTQLNKENEIRRNLSNWVEVSHILVKKIYDLFENENEAYNWFEEHFDSSWRTSLDVFSPKLFKLATVTFEVDVVVPQNYTDKDIIEVANNSDWSDVAASVTEGDDNISADVVERFEYANNPWAFCDSDWDE